MQECQLGLSCILNSRESLTGTVHQAPLEQAQRGSASERLSHLKTMSGTAFLSGLAMTLEKTDFVVAVEKRLENFFF